MASGVRLCRLQADIGYEFVDIDHLWQALTAADAVEENHDGNRRLAQLGDTMIHGVLVDKAYAAGASRSKIPINVGKVGRLFTNQGAASNFIKCTATKKHRAARATKLGIDACIKYSPRQQDQPPSTTVLSLAVSAIVGALWIDCSRDFKVLRQVVEYLW